MILYLFDIDGTLIRAGGAGARALDRVIEARYGIRSAMAGIDAGGKTDPWILEEMFALRFSRAPEPHEIEAILEAYPPVLAEECATSPRFTVLDGAFEIVSWLAARACVVGLATGNTLAGARVKLARAGLWDHFAFGGYGSDSANRAEVVATAIKRGEAFAKAPPDHVVVVGDTMHDVRAAKACNALCVAVTTGTEPRTALEAGGADVVIDSLRDLAAWHEDKFPGSS
ncbi:MAG TPA: HAD family hydrolase [Kofleriaceae bacterium]|nr:HAD family hydrolase [Kofleriaceae bacterium]